MASAPSVQPQLDLWPYEEARRLADRVRDYPTDRAVVFQSGFGPSGLPHLGTMSEVLRPSYVRHALSVLGYQHPTRLIVFIDDMDGLRKVPESVPNREATAAYLGCPVSRIPDPFGGCHDSFASHMIALLGGFLAPVEVEYELIRSSAMYAGGAFDDALRIVLAKHREIIDVVAPTLREDNRAGWSPIMPLCPKCGQINSTLVTAYHPDRATVEFSCERSFGGAHGCAYQGEQSILGGLAKVQWKVDWALRWYVLAVDYELYGKDLIDSARLSGQIVRILGGRPPLGFAFEMFLDEEGHKVSKSVGRGVTVEQWSRYAPIEVLKYFLILNPRRARKLFLESIPQYVDEYLETLRGWSTADEIARRNSPLEFVLQSGSARRFNSSITFSLVMNLVPAIGSYERDLLWRYLVRYDPSIRDDPETESLARILMDCAINFYKDFVEPKKTIHFPSDEEREQLFSFVTWLWGNLDAPPEEIEKKIYDIGRKHYDKPGKIFTLFYKALLGQERGPRLGAFIRLANPRRVALRLQDFLSETANDLHTARSVLNPVSLLMSRALEAVQKWGIAADAARGLLNGNADRTLAESALVNLVICVLVDGFVEFCEALLAEKTTVNREPQHIPLGEGVVLFLPAGIRLPPQMRKLQVEKELTESYYESYERAFEENIGVEFANIGVPPEKLDLIQKLSWHRDLIVPAYTFTELSRIETLNYEAGLPLTRAFAKESLSCFSLFTEKLAAAVS